MVVNSAALSIRTNLEASDPTARVGVLLYDSSFDVDPVLAETAASLRARGVNVGGLLQHFGARLPNGKRSMWITNIGTGATLRLDRPRGAGATPCILDPDALARAACWLATATASGASLIMVNRFGHAEADGRGMRHEIAEAVCSGAAVIIPVKFSLLPDLEGFLGGPAELLLPAPAAIANWVETKGVAEPAPWTNSL